MHLSHPAVHPFHVSNLITPALDGIVRALAERGQTEAQCRDISSKVLTLILSFQPSDAIAITLAGQTVLFNELIADGARDVLRGMTETAKQRSLSGILGMGRLVQGHLDRLEKRGIHPYRTEDALPEADEADDEATTATSAGQPGPDISDQPGLYDGPVPLTVASAATPTNPVWTDESADQPETEEASWLDEPYREWRIETPAELTARECSGSNGPTQASTPASGVANETSPPESPPAGVTTHHHWPTTFPIVELVPARELEPAIEVRNKASAD